MIKLIANTILKIIKMKFLGTGTRWYVFYCYAWWLPFVKNPQRRHLCVGSEGSHETKTTSSERYIILLPKTL